MDGEEETVTVNIDDAFIIKSDTDELCRLCANTDNQLIPIFKGEGLEHNIPNIIEQHLPIVKVTELDKLPLQICYQCASTLIAWHNLYEGCQIADMKLREIFLISDKLYPEDEALTEYVEDYVNDFNDHSQDDYQTLPFNDTVNTSDNPADEILINSHLENTQLTVTQAFDETEEDIPNERCRRNAVCEERKEKIVKEKSPDRRKNVDVVVESIGDARQSRGKVCDTVTYTDKAGDLACDKCEKVIDDEDCIVIKEETDDANETGNGEGDDAGLGESGDGGAGLGKNGDGGEKNQNEGTESRESRMEPENYERFVVQYNKTGIRYMQCDKCQFICRPLANIFHKHYQTHFQPVIEEEEDVKPDISVLEFTQIEPVPALETPPEMPAYAVQVRETVKKSATRERQSVSRSKPFSCTVCGLAFRTRMELKIHKKVHGDRTVSLCCNMCGKNFKTKSGYNHHRANVCVQYTCEICGDLFLVKSVLQDHLKKVHNIEQDDVSVADEGPPKKEQTTSVCPICGKVVTENALSRHMNLHTEDKPYICDLCGKQFRIKWSLREHIMIEIGMKDYVCEICGKKFVIQAYLNKHMRFHMMCEGKFEGYQCEICGKKYAEEWKVKEHQRNSHKGKNLLKYKCDICDKKYTRKWLVRSHKRTAHKDHMEEYQCNFCDKKFTEKWIIKLHLQTVHNINNTPAAAGTAEDSANPDAEVKATSDELAKLLEYHQRISCDQSTDSTADAKTRRKSFECELCGKLFATKQGMKNHLYAELNLRKYVCEICGKRYNWWMGLKEHSIMNHGSKEFVCAFCGKDFPTKKRCRDHLSVHSDARPYNCKCGNSFKLRRYLAKHQKRCNKACVKETLKVEVEEQLS